MTTSTYRRINMHRYRHDRIPDAPRDDHRLARAIAFRARSICPTVERDRISNSSKCFEYAAGMIRGRSTKKKNGIGGAESAALIGRITLVHTRFSIEVTTLTTCHYFGIVSLVRVSTAVLGESNILRTS